LRFSFITARPNWRDQARDLGCLVSTLDDPPYWVEALERPFCAVFGAQEILNIERSTREVTEIAMALVEEVCNGPNSEVMFESLKIPVLFRDPIRNSWQRRDETLYGRMDLCVQPDSIKMLELNFDTPGMLYETSILQLLWLTDKKGTESIPENAGQFNSLHTNLATAWAKLVSENELVHFTTKQGCYEERETVRYLQACAITARLKTKFTSLGTVDWDADGTWVDNDGVVIKNIFKLYPWEYLIQDDLRIRKNGGRPVVAAVLASGDVKFIEPAWKIILSNKACLPLLWQMAPDHELLLPASFDDDSQTANLIRQEPHVRKPIFGREGGSISIIYPDSPEMTTATRGGYGAEGYILQRLHTLPEYDGYHAVIGSWLIDNKPSGIGIRVDKSKITGTQAKFIPHYVQTDLA
jgi:glutathionylspermidine synthase